MKSVTNFNALHGTVPTCEKIISLIDQAKKEEQFPVVERLEAVLAAYPDEKTFDWENDGDAIEVVPNSLLGCLDYQQDEDDEHSGLGKAVSPSDVYDLITNRMIELIKDANRNDYKKTWTAKQYGKGFTIPFNFVSKKRYRGVNVLMLTGLRPMENPFFLTFKQVKDLKGTVKKGAKGFEVVYFTKIWKVEDKPKNAKFSSYDKTKVETFKTENGIENDLGVIPMLKYYHVYNGSDIEGIDFKLSTFKTGFISEEIPADEKNRLPIPEAIIKNYPAPQPYLTFGGDRAYYQPGSDKIQMPYLSDFDTVQDYYRTLLHEYSHSTGAYDRLNRDFSGKQGSKAYAFEELVAEFGATFLSAEAGIIWHTNKNHAAYLKGWNSVLTQLQDDNKFIMRASTLAQKLSDYVLQFDTKGDPKYFKDIKESKPEPIKIAKKTIAKVTVKPKVAKKILKKDNPLKEQFVQAARKRTKSKQLSLFGVKKETQNPAWFPQYLQFKDKPKEAIKYLLKVKKGDCISALYRKDIGYIDIPYGENDANNKGFGLKHIIEKHSKEIAQFGMKIEDFIPIVVSNGVFKISKQKDNRILLDGSMFRIVIKKGVNKTFVLTAFDLRIMPKQKGLKGIYDGINFEEKLREINKITDGTDFTMPPLYSKTLISKNEVTKTIPKTDNSSLKSPIVDLVQPKTTVLPGNENSLAYRLQNKGNIKHEYYNIEDKEISSFLGKIEKKQKESVAITLTGGQGSMKTRMCFRIMNAFAQNYKVGHASIEEHPESKLYEDKIHQYLNEKAMNNIHAPEIDGIADIHKLCRENDVIVIDSFSKLQEMQKGCELDKDFRKAYDGKLFIIIYQQTTDGKMRGGSKSQFDGDIIAFIEKAPDYKDNYVYFDKNRYQDKNLKELKYNIFSGKIETPIVEAKPEPVKFSFEIVEK